MGESECPDHDQLARLVNCQLPEETVDQVLDHLVACRKCEETVAGLEETTRNVLPVGDGIQRSLPFEEETGCREAIERMIDAGPPDFELSIATAPIKPERIFRDYRIVEQIGAGGMGTVYKALHQAMQRQVALKLLPEHRVSDSMTVARFQREMAVLGQLNHPHIVQAFDGGVHTGQHYLVMEFVDGVDLSSLVRDRGPLPMAEACLMIVQAASALQYASEKGIIHRDIKPSNLMLARQGEGASSKAVVKVLDLGLARALDQPDGLHRVSDELTAAGQVMGTIDYMAPEQGTDSHQVDIRTDLYALGATLYKLLSGETPFAAHTNKPLLQRLAAIAQTDPTPIRQLRPDLPDKLAAIVHKLLAKNPDARFQSPKELIQALEPYCVGADLQRLLQPPGSQQETRDPQLPVEPGGSRKNYVPRWVMALGGLGGACLLAVILVLFTKDGVVEVETPDGKLPGDISLVVSQNGADVQILQAENHWQARLAQGQYQVQLKGGDDRFELKDSELTVSRFGRSVLTVRLKPPGGATPAPTAAPTQAGEVAAIPSESAVAADGRPDSIGSIPDIARPFVVVDSQGNRRRDHQFANEALVALRSDEVLEVHGNGPFKVGQMTFQDTTLQIRAGEGFRPRFVAGFDISLEHRNGSIGAVLWFVLNNVTLSVQGCDFLGAPADQFCQFVGTGSHWSFNDCRLIQPWTRVGSVLRFEGEQLSIRRSLVSHIAESGVFANVAGVPQIELADCVMLGRGTVLNVDGGRSQKIDLKRNVFHRVVPITISSAESSDQHPVFVAEENLFAVPFSALVLSWNTTEPRSHLTWRGRGNRYLPTREGNLFGRAGTSEASPESLENVEGWNAYWQGPDDLKQETHAEYAWAPLDQSDWTMGRARIGAEVADARSANPELTGLGPNVEIVGSGKAYDIARNEQNEARLPLLEEGPFVLIREDQIVGGYVTLAQALERAQSGDVIEIRSDASFPPVFIDQPTVGHVTVRAGRGYQPGFASFNAMHEKGEWTLEGLRFLSQAGYGQLNCRIRRLANCSFDAIPGDAYIQLQAAAGQQSVEIVNCYLPNYVRVFAPKVKVDNSIVYSMTLESVTTATWELSRSCFWAHEGPRGHWNGAALGLTCPADSVTRCVDCLIDADAIASSTPSRWEGKRNVYRIVGRRWPALQTAPNAWQPIYTLTDWQDQWQSDQESVERDSAVLRRELWPTSEGTP